MLKDLNLEIRKKSSVAFIGHSGAGKTTLADILMGLLKPAKGDVCVDGVSIFEGLNSWHQIIGYIPQTIYLMDDTIKNNIAFGIEEKEIDPARLKYAVEQAQLSQLIEELEFGLDTKIGEMGVRLSGGQRQALTLLMATLEKPKLLLLDEHTAALDPKTASKVLEVTDRIVQRDGLTTIMITHNMKDAIAHGNRLVMMHEGHIIYDVAGEEKKKLTVSDLLRKFEEASGDEFANDRMMLA